MDFDVTVGIEASPERIWGILMDVETWPSWTPSMSSVKRVEGGRLAVGSSARIRQPRLGSMLWKVTELTEGRSFSWEARRPGLLLVAGHTIESLESNGAKVRLSIHQGGAIGTLFAPLTAGFAKRNVEAEAQGLKKAAESPSPGSLPE
jgi:uncharacterized membrane protein